MYTMPTQTVRLEDLAENLTRPLDIDPNRDAKGNFTPEDDVVLERLEAQATIATDVVGVSWMQSGSTGKVHISDLYLDLVDGSRSVGDVVEVNEHARIQPRQHFEQQVIHVAMHLRDVGRVDEKNVAFVKIGQERG